MKSGYGYGFPILPFVGGRSGIAYNPLTVSNCVRWIDLSDISTVTKDGFDKISAIADKSPTNVAGVQGTAISQPLYVLGGFGTKGLNHMVLDGVANFIDLGTVSSKLANHTLFVVHEYSVLGSTFAVIDERISTGEAKTDGISLLNLLDVNNKTSSIFGDGTNYRFIKSTELNVINTPYLSSNRYSGGATIQLRKNGVGLTEVDNGGTAVSISGTKYKMSIGRYGDFNGGYLNGKIAEILIYDRALTADEVNYIENGLNQKYGVY